MSDPNNIYEMTPATVFFDELWNDFRTQYLNFPSTPSKPEPDVKRVELNEIAYTLLAEYCVSAQSRNFKKAPPSKDVFADIQQLFQGAEFFKVDEWLNGAGPQYLITIR